MINKKIIAVGATALGITVLTNSHVVLTSYAAEVGKTVQQPVAQPTDTLKDGLNKLIDATTKTSNQPTNEAMPSPALEDTEETPKTNESNYEWVGKDTKENHSFNPEETENPIIEDTPDKIKDDFTAKSKVKDREINEKGEVELTSGREIEQAGDYWGNSTGLIVQNNQVDFTKDFTLDVSFGISWDGKTQKDEITNDGKPRIRSKENVNVKYVYETDKDGNVNVVKKGDDKNPDEIIAYVSDEDGKFVVRDKETDEILIEGFDEDGNAIVHENDKIQVLKKGMSGWDGSRGGDGVGMFFEELSPDEVFNQIRSGNNFGTAANSNFFGYFASSNIQDKGALRPGGEGINKKEWVLYQADKDLTKYVENNIYKTGKSTTDEIGNLSFDFGIEYNAKDKVITARIKDTSNENIENSDSNVLWTYNVPDEYIGKFFTLAIAGSTGGSQGKIDAKITKFNYEAAFPTYTIQSSGLPEQLTQENVLGVAGTKVVFYPEGKEPANKEEDVKYIKVKNYKTKDGEVYKLDGIKEITLQDSNIELPYTIIPEDKVAKDVVIHYVDKSGNKIDESTTQTGEIDEAYKIEESKDISGWKFAGFSKVSPADKEASLDKELSGTYSSEEQNVYAVYEKVVTPPTGGGNNGGGTNHNNNGKPDKNTNPDKNDNGAPESNTENKEDNKDDQDGTNSEVDQNVDKNQGGAVDNQSQVGNGSNQGTSNGGQLLGTNSTQVGSVGSQTANGNVNSIQRNKLPQTGEKDNAGLSVFGLILTAIGLGSVYEVLRKKVK